MDVSDQICVDGISSAGADGSSSGAGRLVVKSVSGDTGGDVGTRVASQLRSAAPALLQEVS